MDVGNSREGPGKGFWGHRSAEVVLTVSDVLLVLSSLSLPFSARPSRYYFRNRVSSTSRFLCQTSGLGVLLLNPSPCIKSTLK